MKKTLKLLATVGLGLIVAISAQAAPRKKTAAPKVVETASVQDAAKAAEAAPENTKVKYTTGKTVDFESLLINGQLQRPEISVVTGDAKQGTDGLLRLREHFKDRMTADFGEGSLSQ